MTRADNRKVKRTLDGLPGKHLFISMVDNRLTVMSDMKLYQLEGVMASFMSTSEDNLKAIKRAVAQAERLAEKKQLTEQSLKV